jgi:hypothetical protein
LPIFGPQLVFPREFLGLGDMARGGILLKRAASRVELTYVSAIARGSGAK